MSKQQLRKFKIELLPCPFCGYKYKGLYVAALNGKFECPGCGAEGPIPNRNVKTLEENEDIAAIKAWNQRAEK